MTFTPANFGFWVAWPGVSPACFKRRLFSLVQAMGCVGSHGFEKTEFFSFWWGKPHSKSGIQEKPRFLGPGKTEGWEKGSFSCSPPSLDFLFRKKSQGEKAFFFFWLGQPRIFLAWLLVLGLWKKLVFQPKANGLAKRLDHRHLGLFFDFFILNLS